MQDRVLVVDDDRDTADTLAALIGALGHESLAVYDGQQALAQVQVFAPDMVMLDIGMPGMDGYQTVANIRAAPKIGT